MVQTQTGNGHMTSRNNHYPQWYYYIDNGGINQFKLALHDAKEATSSSANEDQGRESQSQSSNWAIWCLLTEMKSRTIPRHPNHNHLLNVVFIAAKMLQQGKN